MAYVNIYYHREGARLGKHARYIATRRGSTGLHGLGPEFRSLRGDVAAAVSLLEQHAAQARTQTGDGTREGARVTRDADDSSFLTQGASTRGFGRATPTDAPWLRFGGVVRRHELMRGHQKCNWTPRLKSNLWYWLNSRERDPGLQAPRAKTRRREVARHSAIGTSRLWVQRAIRST